MRDVYLKSIKIIKNTINYVKILVVYTVKRGQSIALHH